MKRKPVKLPQPESVSDFKNRIRNLMRGLPEGTINGASHAFDNVNRGKTWPTDERKTTT
jgi:hypothetical protein